MNKLDILYLIFTALILAYPLYAERLVDEKYKKKILYFVYTPLALVILILTVWITISSTIDKNRTERRTESLIGERLLLSSIELRTRYRFEYKNELKAKVFMQKANPIKAYFVNSKANKDYISLTEDKSKIYYPNAHTAEFEFSFSPENASDVYGKPVKFLMPYDQLYLPWDSFIHYLAGFKVGGPVELVSKTLIFQLIINGKVVLDEKQIIKDLAPDTKVLIFRTEPDLFKNIENCFLEMMNISKE